MTTRPLLDGATVRHVPFGRMDTKTPRWTEQQLADYLQCAKDTVRRMRLDGTGPPFTRFGRRGLVRYDPDEVRAWEQESKHNVNGAA